MEKPTLVIMAAGMGSRYGGLKQIDPVDSQGHIIMDFSIFDAMRAGFEKVVFVIKRENEEAFRESIGNRIASLVKVQYVYQELNNLPDGYQVPEGRVKPWGTAHAVLGCAQAVKGPLAVINADDYYGPHAFQMIYDFLTSNEDDSRYHYTMVGYLLKNTVTEHGYVARGVCQMDEEGYLHSITERTRIECRPEGIAYTEDNGVNWFELPEHTIVSMNMWGFSNSILTEIQQRFRPFLERNLQDNPLKCEYFLPSVVEELLEEGRADVKVLSCADKWYGVTYKEDKAVVVAAIENMVKEGIYPADFGGK